MRRYLFSVTFSSSPASCRSWSSRTFSRRRALRRSQGRAAVSCISSSNRSKAIPNCRRSRVSPTHPPRACAPPSSAARYSGLPGGGSVCRRSALATRSLGVLLRHDGAGLRCQPLVFGTAGIGFRAGRSVGAAGAGRCLLGGLALPVLLHLGGASFRSPWRTYDRPPLHRQLGGPACASCAPGSWKASSVDGISDATVGDAGRSLTLSQPLLIAVSFRPLTMS